MVSVNHHYTYMWIGNERGWIFDNLTGKTMLLNKTALEIFKCMLEGMNNNETISFLSNKYNQEAFKIEQQITDIIKSIKGFGIFKNAGKEIEI